MFVENIKFYVNVIVKHKIITIVDGLGHFYANKKLNVSIKWPSYHVSCRICLFSLNLHSAIPFWLRCKNSRLEPCFTLKCGRILLLVDSSTQHRKYLGSPLRNLMYSSFSGRSEEETLQLCQFLSMGIRTPQRKIVQLHKRLWFVRIWFQSVHF